MRILDAFTTGHMDIFSILFEKKRKENKLIIWSVRAARGNTTIDIRVSTASASMRTSAFNSEVFCNFSQLLQLLTDKIDTVKDFGPNSYLILPLAQFNDIKSRSQNFISKGFF